jgi:RNA polymerase sigma-70 factor (ECF subfamily)
MTRDRQAADDLAQDCFVTAWQKLRSLERDASFEPWLMRIASNLTLNFLKKRSLQAETSLDELDNPIQSELSNRRNPEDDLSRKELRQEVLDFMATLPEAQRLVFDLRFYQQLSFEEIATITDRAVGTVKTNYRHAILKLRKTAVGRGWVL